MAKRPTPSKASAAAPAKADDAIPGEADTSAPPPPAPEHLEAASAAEAAVAQATAPPLASEADPTPEAEPAARKVAGDETADAPYSPSAINSQILSSTVDADVLALGLAPSQSQAMLDAIMSQTLGLAMHNAVIRQQADRVVSQALISVACARMVERVGFAIGTPPASPKPTTSSKPAAEKAS